MSGEAERPPGAAKRGDARKRISGDGRAAGAAEHDRRRGRRDMANPVLTGSGQG